MEEKIIKDLLDLRCEFITMWNSLIKDGYASSCERMSCFSQLLKQLYDNYAGEPQH